VPETKTDISNVLQQRSDQLIALLNNWDSEQAQLIFADNVALDESFERQQATALKIISEHGPLVIKSITPSSHVEAVIECVNGKKIEILLGPVHTAPIQWYELK
jgi:hypothetical protein